MWFKNSQIFRFTENVHADGGEWNEKLQDKAFIKLLSNQLNTSGFVPPIKSLTDEYFHVFNGHGIFCIKQQEKVIPASVIKEALEEKIEHIQNQELRKITRKERADLKDDIILELTPKAFSKTKNTMAYIGFKDQILVIDSPSATQADAVIDCLREALGSAPLIPVTPKMIPAQMMTQWLSSSTAPDGFEFGTSIVLKDLSDQGAVIRCKHIDLLSNEITAHLNQGFSVSELSFIFQEKIQFTLTEKLAIKQIKLCDVFSDQLDHETPEDEVASFQQDFSVMSLEFSALFHALITAFGGENLTAKKEKLEQALITA